MAREILTRQPVMQTPLKPARILLFTAILAIWLITAFRAVSLLNLNPDSANYINASQNWLQTGRLFVYANFPSWSLEPQIEQYTEQPPGMPYLMAPFLLLVKEPAAAAAVLQVLAILFLFGGVYAIGADLGYGLLFQLSSAAAFALFAPLVFVYPNFWSEVPFIALTIWSLHFLARSEHSRRQNLDWLAALLLAAAATTVRSVGILTLPVFLFAAWRRGKIRWLYFLLSIAFVTGPLLAWSLRNRFLYGASSATHVLQVRSEWSRVIFALDFLRDMISPYDILTAVILGFCILCVASPFLGASLGRLSGFRLQISQPRFGILRILITLQALPWRLSPLGRTYFGFGGSPGIRFKQIALADSVS